MVCHVSDVSQVMSYQGQRRRNITVPDIPVWVELRQIPVIHILQSLLGRVTASRPLQDKFQQKHECWWILSLVDSGRLHRLHKN